MTKILIFNGSPRKKGNTAALIKECLRGMGEAGNEAEVFVLNKMKIKPCQFCDWCIKNSELTCVKKDDMSELYPKLLQSEVIVFAVPIFWFTVSAQMKLFMDRLYALHTKEGYALVNKKVAAIMVYGDDNVERSGVNNAIGTMHDLFRYMRSENLGIVHGTAWAIGDAEKNNQLMSDVYNLGKKIEKNISK
ncbi:MAG TPA: flavodoxin family protein [Candidatus Bathyarchaeia archaeon]|nr:flavodoxin family protein [Candidatus Bathyarchaeia archaeon]